MFSNDRDALVVGDSIFGGDGAICGVYRASMEKNLPMGTHEDLGSFPSSWLLLKLT